MSDRYIQAINNLIVFLSAFYHVKNSSYLRTELSIKNQIMNNARFG